MSGTSLWGGKTVGCERTARTWLAERERLTSNTLLSSALSSARTSMADSTPLPLVLRRAVQEFSSEPRRAIEKRLHGQSGHR